MTQHTTICAIATPAGGAIGIVRVSGPEAIRIAQHIFEPAGSQQLEQKAGGTLSFGRITDPHTREVVDEVLVSLFRAPHSYTGEDSVEISCHGSHYILSRVVQLLIEQGCTLARPGEYTQRAFLNGKMDLSQAEAVADLIASSTAANHRMAIQQLRGGFSNELRGLRDKLLHLTSLMELELDFSDHEDLEFAPRTELLELATHIRQRITRLSQSFRLGNALKRGLPIALIGETNAGKSTLLNALLGEQRALVSNIHGTTRDTVEETLVVGDTLVRLIDTAGIRNTDDLVEQLGIARTYDKMDEAELVLWLIDATQAEVQYTALLPEVQAHSRNVILLLNKADLLTPETRQTLLHSFETRCGIAPTPNHTANSTDIELIEENKLNETTKFEESLNEKSETTKHTNAQITAVQCLSARNEADVDHLRTLLATHLQTMQSALGEPGDTIVSNARHYEALLLAQESIDRVIAGLQSGLSGDFVSQDLRECIHHLSDIIGEVSTDAVLHNIFKHFCIGK